MTGRSLLFLATLCLSPAHSYGADDQTPSRENVKISWQRVDEDEGVTVYRRQTPGSRFVEFRGVGEVDAPIPKIIALMADVTNMPHWVFGCVKGELIERNFTEDDLNRAPSDYHQVLYGVNTLPWPLRNRDYVLQANVNFIPASPPEPFRVVLAMHAVEHRLKPVEPGFVRMPEMRTTIIFTPLDSDLRRTTVDFSVITDPGGLIPDWVTNFSTRNIPRKTIATLREFSKSTAYSRKMEKLVMHHYLRSIPHAPPS